jgi:hypothetical protein
MSFLSFLLLSHLYHAFVIRGYNSVVGYVASLWVISRLLEHSAFVFKVKNTLDLFDLADEEISSFETSGVALLTQRHFQKTRTTMINL